MSAAEQTLSLEEDQLAHFDREGYLHLPGRFDEKQIAVLRASAAAAEEQAMSELRSQKKNRDYFFSTTFFKTHLNRLLQFHLHAGPSSLAILGCEEILAAAQSLCGAPFVPTIDMMVLKHGDSNATIPWHQDLIYPSERYRIATFGIYLDDSAAGDGALKVIPGSQTHKQDICAIVRQPPNNIVELPAKAGDLLIHNPMIVHSSAPMTSAQKRRTLYYEFRPLVSLKHEPDWGEQLIQSRLSLLRTALKQQPHPKSLPWLDGYQAVADLSCLYAEPLPFNTANFCPDSMKAQT